MPKIGVVGVSDGWSSEALADAAHKKTGQRWLIDMAKVHLDLETQELWYEGERLSTFDALIIKKVGAWYSPDLLDRLELLRFLESKGVRCFSSPEKIIRMLDRLSCTITLRAADIPMPPTIITENVEKALEKVEEYGEAIFKPLYSTKARGMTLIQPGEGAEQKIVEFQKCNNMMYIQKKLDLNGSDLGVSFLGGKYLTTYARVKGEKAWNTTIHSGGKYAPFQPEQEIIELADKAQRLFGLDFTSVDIAQTEIGPVVFEVSAFGGFSGIIKTSDIEIPEFYVDYVIDRI